MIELLLTWTFYGSMAFVFTAPFVWLATWGYTLTRDREDL